MREDSPIQVAEKGHNLNGGGRMKNADVLNCGCFLHYSFFLLHSSFRLAVFQQPAISW
jgi:hypothetical protein